MGKDLTSCSKAIRHSPPDARGRCKWCGEKWTDALPKPLAFPTTDLSDSYGYSYDPDWTGREEW